MYYVDKCLDQKLCRARLRLVDAIPAQRTALVTAVEQLQQAVKATGTSLDNCFVFTLENRNHLMRHIADVKEQANELGCGRLQELCALAEIITMILFRSNHYRDHQGLEQIEKAVQHMQSCTIQLDPQCPKDRAADRQIAEAIEGLWQWVDNNTLSGMHILNEKPSRSLMRCVDERD
jgi:chorismate mutase